MLDSSTLGDLRASVAAFTKWLDAFGEDSYDHQTFFAGPVGGAAKRLYYRHKAIGTLAVVPIIACEAFTPSARRLFWKRQRFPIADAHYASGFAFLACMGNRDAHLRRAIHFLEVLMATRCQRFSHYAWGYPFDWATLRGTIVAGTPLITTVPYVYEAFEQVYRLDHSPRWLEIMRSIAEHAVGDYRDHAIGADTASCSYTPNDWDQSGVVNASAYRAFLLTKAGCDLNDSRYTQIANRNLNFVLSAQNPDGSWYYAVDHDHPQGFVDHFHTCFVLKALAKIEALTGDERCGRAIERGVEYYLQNLFDDRRLPKPFARRPRLTVYRRELYDYAECINIGVLLRGRFSGLDDTVAGVVRDLLRRWRKGTARSERVNCSWAGTTSRCTVGHKRSFSEACHF
jgi:hypothetical protein